jgi:hypothetical protein
MQHRRPVLAAALPAEAHQHHAHHPDDEGIGDDIGNADEIAEDAEGQRKADHQDARQAVGRLAGGGRRRLAQLAQEKIQRNHRNQRPVAVFRRDPGLAKRDEAQPVDRDRRKHHQQEPAKPGRAEGADRQGRGGRGRHMREISELRENPGKISGKTLSARPPERLETVF